MELLVMLHKFKKLWERRLNSCFSCSGNKKHLIVKLHYIINEVLWLLIRSSHTNINYEINITNIVFWLLSLDMEFWCKNKLWNWFPHPHLSLMISFFPDIFILYYFSEPLLCTIVHFYLYWKTFSIDFFPFHFLLIFRHVQPALTFFWGQI